MGLAFGRAVPNRCGSGTGCGGSAGGEPRLLKPGYFSVAAGRPVNFMQDFFAPFVERFIREIREEHPQAFIFVSPPPVEIQNGPANSGWKRKRGIRTRRTGTMESR